MSKLSLLFYMPLILIIHMSLETDFEKLIEKYLRKEYECQEKYLATGDKTKLDVWRAKGKAYSEIATDLRKIGRKYFS